MLHVFCHNLLEGGLILTSVEAGREVLGGGSCYHYTAFVSFDIVHNKKFFSLKTWLFRSVVICTNESRETLTFCLGIGRSYLRCFKRSVSVWACQVPQSAECLAHGFGSSRGLGIGRIQVPVEPCTGPCAWRASAWDSVSFSFRPSCSCSFSKINPSKKLKENKVSLKKRPVRFKIFT